MIENVLTTQDANGTEEEVVTLTPEQEIDCMEAMDEVNELSNQAYVISDEIEDAEKVITALSMTNTVNSNITNASETTATVVASNLSATFAMLGLPEDGLLTNLSGDKTPDKKIELTTQAKESLMTRIIEGIKAGFKKFMVMLKKIYAKSVIAIANIEDKARKMSLKFATSKKDSIFLPTEDLVSIYNKYGSMAISDNENISIKKLEDTLDIISDKETLEIPKNIIDELDNILLTTLKESNKKPNNLQQLYKTHIEKVIKVLINFNTVEKWLDYKNAYIVKYIKDKKLKGQVYDLVFPFVSKNIGREFKINYIAVKDAKSIGSDIESRSDFINALKSVTVSGMIAFEDSTVLKKLKRTLSHHITPLEAKIFMVDIADKAKAFKKFNEVSSSVSSSIEKRIELIGKRSLSDVEAGAVAPLVRNANTWATSYQLDLVLNYLKACQAGLYIGGLIIKNMTLLSKAKKQYN